MAWDGKIVGLLYISRFAQTVLSIPFNSFNVASARWSCVSVAFGLLLWCVCGAFGSIMSKRGWPGMGK